METLTTEGAVPFKADTLSQLPPSDVLVSRVQFNVPLPAFRICTAWLGGAAPPVCSEKLICPGRLSKNGPAVGSATVSVTGTVSVCVPSRAVSTICPVYVPTCMVTTAFTTAVRFSGVEHSAQSLKLALFTVSQLPPAAVAALNVNVKSVPVLAIVNVCGSGLAPFTGLVKLIAFTWRKTLSPTTTVTGTVTFSPPVRNTSSPTKVPAINPWPGRFCFVTETLTSEGAVPLWTGTLSQLPPSAVLVSSVQLNVPVPAFRICTAWLGGAAPPVCIEKLICPGRLSKKAPAVGSATVSVTGTVRVCVPSRAVKTICPV